MYLLHFVVSKNPYRRIRGSGGCPHPLKQLRECENNYKSTLRRDNDYERTTYISQGGASATTFRRVSATMRCIRSLWSCRLTNHSSNSVSTNRIRRSVSISKHIIVIRIFSADRKKKVSGRQVFSSCCHGSRRRSGWKAIGLPHKSR